MTAALRRCTGNGVIHVVEFWQLHSEFCRWEAHRFELICPILYSVWSVKHELNVILHNRHLELTVHDATQRRHNQNDTTDEATSSFLLARSFFWIAEMRVEFLARKCSCNGFTCERRVHQYSNICGRLTRHGIGNSHLIKFNLYIAFYTRLPQRRFAGQQKCKHQV